MQAAARSPCLVRSAAQHLRLHRALVTRATPSAGAAASPPTPTKTPLASQSASLSAALEESAVPPTPRALGYLGAVPFLAGGLGSGLLGMESATAMTQVYGAAILSFLGGTHWGLALRIPVAAGAAAKAPIPALSSAPATWPATASALATHVAAAGHTDFVVAVCPSLIAAAAAAAPPQVGLPVLSMSFAALWGFERFRWRGQARLDAGVPRWYVGLRVPLTVAAAGATFVAGLSARRVRNAKRAAEEERREKAITAKAAAKAAKAAAKAAAVAAETAVVKAEETPQVEAQVDTPATADQEDFAAPQSVVANGDEGSSEEKGSADGK